MRLASRSVKGGTDVKRRVSEFFRTKKPGQSDLEFQMRNWWHFSWISGDHIVEQAVHSIDRLSWAMGDKPPKLVNCLGGRAARSGPEHGDAFENVTRPIQRSCRSGR